MKRQRLTVALAGNPNSGKSTIFNNLTGARQHVGNYPGVTVEKKEGLAVYKNYEITFVDLPGAYSLSAYSEDELVARNFIIREKPDVVVDIVDASNIERNLYFFTQLMELGVPTVLVMNMSDIVEKKGHTIDYDELSKLMGTPIVPTVGNKNKGIDKLLETIVGVYNGQIKYERVKIDYGAEIDEQLELLKTLLDNTGSVMDKVPADWVAIKLFENDISVSDAIAELPAGKDIIEQVEKGRKHLRQHFADDMEVLIADRRYGFISGACTQAVRQTVEVRHDVSDMIDKIILSRFLGLPIFALVMYGIFKFTFAFSGPAIGLFELFFDKLSGFIVSVMPESLMRSFIIDAVIGGVGGVLGFVPLVLFMFFAIAFFEDSGYMARAAFVMDKIMGKFGLHGKSFLPMMISTNGCAVPGILATRTLDNKRDRLITMLVTPFMICGAKLPIFALFIGAFFTDTDGPNVMFFMYFISIVIALVSAWVLDKFVVKGERTHLVMELPPYRMPTLQGLFLKMWERGWLYVKKAGTIILLISIIVWAGFTFPQPDKNKITGNDIKRIQIEQSFVGRMGQAIEPVMKPIGLDWRAG
ncbi:MAG: ferrous iron transport protein B, partial [Candidatus Omnitrophota bacterium]